jgi:hypothetical protein
LKIGSAAIWGRVKFCHELDRFGPEFEMINRLASIVEKGRSRHTCTED